MEELNERVCSIDICPYFDSFGMALCFAMHSGWTSSPPHRCANRLGPAELGWFPCSLLLERVRFLQGSEAISAHGTVVLQGVEFFMEGWDAIIIKIFWNWGKAQTKHSHTLSSATSREEQLSNSSLVRPRTARWWPRATGCRKKCKPGCATRMLSIESSERMQWRGWGLEANWGAQSVFSWGELAVDSGVTGP